ncbi:MAG TPA: hypothetical protein VH025_05610 [Solirubrobacteraceae bacterium]|jgi:hypothetical protein|nr:hypothetical protein [Solirubrobacteraceae bacterium]
MSMVISWILFPLVLTALGAGWGVLVERAAGEQLADALLIPLGLAAALVLAGTLTTFDATAKTAVPVAAAGAIAGLALGRPWRRLLGWWAIGAIGALLAYGAPVLLSGQATFTGYLRLDDTATWFNVVDHLFSHARSVAHESPSSFQLIFSGDVGPSYPLGAFVLPGIGRALVGSDIAWVFAPYLAFCGAAVSMSLFTLFEPLVASARIRALLSFVAAQSALLYGYALWGGIKEMTAAFLLVLGAALAGALITRPPSRWRGLLPLATAVGALIQVLGPGAGGWVAPALVIVLVCWLLRGRGLRETMLRTGQAVLFTAIFVVPVWAVASDFFSDKGGLFKGLFSSGQSEATRLGNLYNALSGAQLAGIWPTGDFRVPLHNTLATALIGVVFAAAIGGVAYALRRRELGLALYVAIALIGSGVLYLVGSTPWVTGKALAISSPAVIAAALVAGGALWSEGCAHPLRSIAGALLTASLLGGVVWSNVLGYHDATLAPRDRLAELQHIDDLLPGRGPTFVNTYEIYADRHFLGSGAPVEPAEYREATLALYGGTYLTKAAAADIDSFPLSTLAPYPSIVTPRSPVESRPPSNYELRWQGKYFQLWQHSPVISTKVIEHVPLGDSNTQTYCGQAQEGKLEPLCSIDPVAVPTCERVLELGHKAEREGAKLVAYARPEPIVIRGDQTQWPASWFHDVAGHSLTATQPGTLTAHVALDHDTTYELWLSGTFSRGFDVAVDGRALGRISNELSTINTYIPVTKLRLSAGVHTVMLTYPHPDSSPGSGENELTSLSEIALAPLSPAPQMLTVAPGEARSLCGRELDWIELTRSV